jgi:hypothetical protein
MWVVWQIMGHMRWYAGHHDTLKEATDHADELAAQGKRLVVEYVVVKEVAFS